MRLSGKNFQSWAVFDVEVDGLTMLTGPSDTGKSAIFRALKGALRNELPAEWVRDGQDDPMEVAVEWGGRTVVAQRSRKGSTRYVVYGQGVEGEECPDPARCPAPPGAPHCHYAKLAGAAPEFLTDLRFNEVAVGDFDVDPIFGRQNSAQFLIDPETFKPTEVNAILGAFGGTEKLERGKKEANLRKTQRDSEARGLAAQIRAAEERKGALAGMKGEADGLDLVLRASEAAIATLEAESAWLGGALAALRRLEPLRGVVGAVVLPDMSGLVLLWDQALHAERAAESAAYARWLGKPTAAIAAAADSWAGLRALWNELAAVEAAAEAGRRAVSTDRLRTSLSGAELMGAEAERLWGSIRRLESLAALLGEIAGSAGKLAGVESELSAARAEAQKGLCPRCGRPVEHVCGGQA